MERDSLTKSIWQTESRLFPSSTEVPEGKIFDILIVGAGITGLTAGLLLQEAGKKCIICEAHNVGYGTSSGTTAHLNTLLDTHYYDIIKKFGIKEAELIASGTEEAISMVKAHVKVHHIDCDFTHCNGYIYSENETQSKYLENIRIGMQEVGISSRYATSIPIPVPFEKALCVPGQAYFNPIKYLFGLAKAFTASGGQIINNAFIEYEKVQNFDHYSTAFVGNTPIMAQNIVYATHYPPGLNLLHLECSAYRSYVLGVQPEDDRILKDVVYDLRDPYNYFRPATIQGKSYLIAGGFDHPTGRAENENQSFTSLEAYLRKHFKIKSVDYKWSAQFYKSADGLPYIGRLPGTNERTFVATGFNGTGMTWGTLAGKIISKIILTNDSEFKNLLSPSRVKPVAGFNEMLKKNANVIKHFVGDRINLEKIKELAAIRNGEGKVISYEGKKIALYKDRGGNLKALSPICPHAKCLVKWNSAEKSWDCPCHGSRFTPDGEILTGPASKPLEKISLAKLKSEKT